MSDRNAATGLGKQIGTLFDLGALGAMPDRSLLDQFGRGGEPSEAAFATLVERHGPLVLRVCRHVLADGHLAEDAFQVTFLLLARRARSLHDPDALAGWLHRVARRVALRARAANERRRQREETRVADVEVVGADPLISDELGEIIHEEIDRLADVQRLPILLCALEGLSHEEAAQRLRWPLGTVKSRLVRARRRLQGRLERRGLAPAWTVFAGDSRTHPFAAPVPLWLAISTTKAAVQLVHGSPAAAAALSGSIARLLQSELSAMFLANVRLAAGITVAGAAAILMGITLAGLPSQGAQGIEARAAAAEPIASGVPIARAAGPTGGSAPGPGIPENRALTPRNEQVIRIVSRPEHRATALGQEVGRAIRQGVRFLKSKQRPDGSWTDIEKDATTGPTSLAVLALLAAGEKPDSPAIERALELLRGSRPENLRSTYAIALQTMVFAGATPERDRPRIAANAMWLTDAQIKATDPQQWPGAWSYSEVTRNRPGDNSNTQYALLGLQAASEVGVPIDPAAWQLARTYWESCQQKDGSWAYTRESRVPTASMTCAGISGLALARSRRLENSERVDGNAIRDCGKGGYDAGLSRGLAWLGSHFRIDQNFGSGAQWRFYYLYGLERAGRLAGARFIGEHDWYRLGAEDLVRAQHQDSGSWQGELVEKDQVLATSFALLFLAKGRAPVLINKLRHGPNNDWNSDPDDVANLVGIVSRDWKSVLSWQTVDSTSATVADLGRAPILFVSGHKAPEFSPELRANLRAYVDGGGTIVGDACCGSAEFDQGFRKLMAEIFPAKEDALQPLPGDHAIWRARFFLVPEPKPLWGIRRPARTVVIYSSKDLSCFWNQSERNLGNPAVIAAIKVGQNIIDYITRREMPPDKLSER